VPKNPAACTSGQFVTPAENLRILHTSSTVVSLRRSISVRRKESRVGCQDTPVWHEAISECPETIRPEEQAHRRRPEMNRLRLQTTSEELKTMWKWVISMWK